MARIYVGIGSNIEREHYIRAGVEALAAQFSPLTLSTVYESEAVGFAGENFYNLAAGFDSELPLQEIAHRLRQIEAAHGRVRGTERFAARTLDIDILLYDDLVTDQPVQLPREEILRNAFVLRPLAEIAPQLQHPVAKQPLQALWGGFSAAGQALWPVPFEF